MSAFLVYVREDTENKPAVRMSPYYGGYEPPEPVWCADIVVAENRDQAKHLFLKDWTSGSKGVDSPVYHDDWNLLRVRLLGPDDLSEDQRWMRIHEILEHGNRPCDCPEWSEEDETSL